MMNLINEQIQLILEDLELITNPYERSMVRAHLIGSLTNMNTSYQIETDSLPKGKDAIKNDIPKQEIIEKQFIKESKEQTVENDAPITFEESVNQEEQEKTGPVEIDIDPDTKEDIEPIMTQIEDEEGNVFDIDITEAYNKLSADLSEEERIDLARNITAYNLLPVYEELSQLPDCNDKMMLSYYLQQLGIDEIDAFVESLTDGQFNLLHDFVNKDNLEYLVTEIATAMEE